MSKTTLTSWFGGMAAAFLVMSLTACSQAPASLDRSRAFGAKLAMEEMAPPAPEGAAASDRVVPAADGQERQRKQIKTGFVNLEAGDLTRTEALVADRAAALGGFVERSAVYEAWVSMTVRIPAESFDQFLRGLEGMGKLTGREVTVADVTTQYYDLETRLENQRLLLDQYRAFMDRTEKMDEILDVMARISNLTAEIENLEGQFRYLGRQVDLATLTVEIRLPPLQGGRTWPDLGEGFENLWFSVVGFGYQALFFILGLLIYLPVIIGVVVGLLWLLWGRVGLLRRLLEVAGLRKPRAPAGAGTPGTARAENGGAGQGSRSGES